MSENVSPSGGCFLLNFLLKETQMLSCESGSVGKGRRLLCCQNKPYMSSEACERSFGTVRTGCSAWFRHCGTVSNRVVNILWCCWCKNITDVDYLPHCVTILISVTIKSEFVIPWFMSCLAMCQISIMNNNSHAQSDRFESLFYQFGVKCEETREVR